MPRKRQRAKRPIESMRTTDSSFSDVAGGRWRPPSVPPGLNRKAEALENMRAFFTILQEWDEWDEEDRQAIAHIGYERQERAARTIAEHFREDVELE